MTKALLIIAQDKFRDEELLHTKEELENGGIGCVVASITTDTAKGMLGAQVVPDIAVKDAKADDYDAIIVVGGLGSPGLATHNEVLSILKDGATIGKVIGAICLGPMVPAKAGLLQGKKATCYITEESKKALAEGGAHLIEEDVVVDGKVVTGNGPKAARKFGKAILELLK